MIKILMPVTSRPEEYLKCAQEVCPLGELIIGVTRSIAEKYDFKVSGAVVKVYEDGSCDEEILNALQPLLDGSATLVARKPFTKDELNAFINNGNQIVVSKKKTRGKFAQFFVNLGKKIVKALFGVNLFNGSSSLIYFGDEAANVLASVNNFSYSTRIDRWKGYTKGAEPTSSQDNKISHDKKNLLGLLLGGIGSFIVGALVTTLCLLFAKVNIIGALLIACLDVICLCVGGLLIIAYIFNNKFGNKHYKTAIEA